MITVNQLSDLAKEAAKVQDVDFNGLLIERDAAYTLMASNVLTEITKLPEDQRLIVAMATITNLLVENFIINIRLEKK